MNLRFAFAIVALWAAAAPVRAQAPAPAAAVTLADLERLALANNPTRTAAGENKAEAQVFNSPPPAPKQLP